MNIKVINATKIFQLQTSSFTACDNISIDIQQGDFISFVGHTGSGKSTLLSMIGCILKPTSGSIYYDSFKASNASESKLASIRRRYFSFIFQYPVIVPTMTVIDNILMPTAFKRGANDKKIKLTKENIALFGLYEKQNMLAGRLSGGEMKKVSILRALAYGGNVLIADEPTSDLDPKTTKILMDIFHTINKQNVTIVMVTHAKDIAAHARSVYEMSDGKMLRCLK